MKYRALVIGGGRIGAGYGWQDYPFTYTHAQAYAMNPRCDFVGIVEPNAERAAWCRRRWGVAVFDNVPDALKTTDAEIVSVCVPPKDTLHHLIHGQLAQAKIKAAWWEKPYLGPTPAFPIQVNYIRRFDRSHQVVASMVQGCPSKLFVWAKDDIHTRCHFEDLARWWGSELIYNDNSGEIPATNAYWIDSGKWRVEWRNGGVQGGFMEAALENLIDFIEDKSTLLSPARTSA